MQRIKLNQLKNAYCDAVGLALSEFIDVRSLEDENDIVCHLTNEELAQICEYAVIKNKLAGVGELNLKVPEVDVAKRFFDMHNLAGRVILSARLIDCLSASDFVGGRLMLEIESLVEYNEDFLSKIVDFCAITQSPILIKMGQTLEEVGKIVNKFGCSPAEVLEEYGFLDRECYIYGLNFIDKEDQKLLTKYQPTLILSPRDDAESGLGAINLYNFIYNGLKFVFSSGKCYQIDMFAEGKLAIYNTSNLMYERGLVDHYEILSYLQSKEGELMLEFDEDSLKESILDKRIEVKDEKISLRLLKLRDNIKQIAKKIKEKLS